MPDGASIGFGGGDWGYDGRRFFLALQYIYILTVSHTQYISVQDPADAPHYLMRAVGFSRNTDFARCLFTQWLEDKIRLVGLSYHKRLKKKKKEIIRTLLRL